MLSTDLAVLVAMAADEAGLGHERLLCIAAEWAVTGMSFITEHDVAWFRGSSEGTVFGGGREIQGLKHKPQR
jgi:hypothetical protein